MSVEGDDPGEGIQWRGNVGEPVGASSAPLPFGPHIEATEYVVLRRLGRRRLRGLRDHSFIPAYAQFDNQKENYAS